MSVYEIPVPRRRRRMVLIQTTEELISGFFWACCGKWSPDAEHRCLAAIRTRAK